MKDGTTLEDLRKHEIPERVTIVKGGGDLPKISVKTDWSTAEIYLLGAHVTGFQKNGEPPLLFMSRASQFAIGKAIRGGVPIIFPWFGAREGFPSHGFARVTEWEWEGSSAAPDGSVTLRFRLPTAAHAAGSASENVIFAVTVSDKLTMELTVTNPSRTENLSFENCLHTYFFIGDVAEVEITGLKGTSYIDKVDNFRAKLESADAIRITSETDRVYLDTTGAVGFTTPGAIAKFAWRKSARHQRWFGIHGRPKPSKCPISATVKSLHVIVLLLPLFQSGAHLLRVSALQKNMVVKLSYVHPPNPNCSEQSSHVRRS